MFPLAALIWLNFNGESSQLWNGEVIPATPAFLGDQQRRDVIVAGVAAYFIPFNVQFTQKNQPGTFEVLIGGDGSWTGQPWAGISLVGAYGNLSDTQRSYVFPDIYGLRDDLISLGIAHELGHDFGLWHQLGVPSIMAPDPDGVAMPGWVDAPNELGNPQNDVQIIGDAVGYAPEPSLLAWLMVGLLGRRRTK